jgi:hypothetical protein
MDDMMGLEYGGLGAWLDTEVLVPTAMDTLIMGAGGAAAGIGLSMALEAVQSKVDFLKRDSEMGQRIQTAGIQLVVGSLAAMYSMQAGSPNMEKVAMGAAVSLGTLAAINLWNAIIAKDKPIALSALPEDMELSGDMDYSNSMEALAALEATNVSAAPGAFQGFGDPTVTPEALMGFYGTVTQEETLGAYAPYLS